MSETMLTALDRTGSFFLIRKGPFVRVSSFGVSKGGIGGIG